jgi:hypothetical protein
VEFGVIARKTVLQSPVGKFSVEAMVLKSLQGELTRVR